MWCLRMKWSFGKIHETDVQTSRENMRIKKALIQLKLECPMDAIVEA